MPLRLSDRAQLSLLAGAAFLGTATYAYNSVLYGAKDRELEEERLALQNREEERKDKQQEARARVYESTREGASAVRETIRAKMNKSREE